MISKKVTSKLNTKTKQNKVTKKVDKKNEQQDDTYLVKCSEKYKVALKFVNKILINFILSQIDDLIQFQDINRNYIYNEMEKELFKYFDKKIIIPSRKSIYPI